LLIASFYPYLGTAYDYLVGIVLGVFINPYRENRIGCDICNVDVCNVDFCTFFRIDHDGSFGDCSKFRIADIQSHFGGIINILLINLDTASDTAQCQPVDSYVLTYGRNPHCVVITILLVDCHIIQCSGPVVVRESD